MVYNPYEYEQVTRDTARVHELIIERTKHEVARNVQAAFDNFATDVSLGRYATVDDMIRGLGTTLRTYIVNS